MRSRLNEDTVEAIELASGEARRTEAVRSTGHELWRIYDAAMM